jgi:hypothetical protein
MSNLCLPECVTVRLISWSGEPFRRADILVGIHTLARHKNDFHLGPYPTNTDGVSIITQKDLQAEVKATYSSGMMDYNNINDCFPLVEIRLWSIEEISRSLECRTNIWNGLLEGENERWNSIDELLALYRRALAASSLISGPFHLLKIRDEWAKERAVFDYTFNIQQSEES